MSIMIAVITVSQLDSYLVVENHLNTMEHTSSLLIAIIFRVDNRAQECMDNKCGCDSYLHAREMRKRIILMMMAGQTMGEMEDGRSR